ncbi:NAD(P)/FAD-dependent oxidoreductase [Chloroflexota bacterium]
MGNSRQVIIGNSAAGLSAIKAIREIDRLCPITLISAESCNAYSPVLLTYYLKQRLSREDLFIVDSDFYKVNGIKTIFGSKATRVDPSRQVVYLENGQKVDYDNLLIATGAFPMSLDSSEDVLANVFSLRTIEDAEKIAECAKTAKEVIVIGAGLIGLQIVDALCRQGPKLTLIEWSEQVLPESVDAECADLVQKEIESHGISVLLNKRVKGIRKSGKKTAVISDSGEEWVADMVIVGIGLKPNIQLVDNTGIEVNRGIVVDETIRTNINNVFAAGDVSEGEDLVTGNKKVLPNWINACKQGRVTGSNMAGCQQSYEGGLSETITTIFGLTVVGIGLPRAPKSNGLEELKFSDPERKSYRKILLAGNRIMGAVLLGRTRDAGILRNLITNKKDVSPWKDGIARAPMDMRRLLLSITAVEGFEAITSKRRRK